MLKQRIITAALLAALALWAVLGWTPLAFAAGVGVVLLLGAWEWSALAGLQAVASRAVFVVAVGLLLVGLALLPVLQPQLLWAALPWWLLAAVSVLRFPESGALWDRRTAVRTVAGFLVLVPTWVALVALRGDGSGARWVLFVLLLIWTADTAAYFAGRRFGRRKLAPAVSPGKSWEGLYGALAGTAVLALAAMPLLGVPGGQAVPFLLLCLVTVVSSVLGDLFESLIKRTAGVKDSGHLLPGHGGILDRIDSLTAAAPVFAIGFALMGGFA